MTSRFQHLEQKEKPVKKKTKNYYCNQWSLYGIQICFQRKEMKNKKCFKEEFIREFF